jgi:hypothetical protein
MLSCGCTPGSPERCICNDIPEGSRPRSGIIGGKNQPRLKVPNGFREGGNICREDWQAGGERFEDSKREAVSITWKHKCACNPVEIDESIRVRRQAVVELDASHVTLNAIRLCHDVQRCPVARGRAQTAPGI